jgi:PD-(D/E)XK endonuclease
MLTTDQKGAIAESKIAAAAIELRLGVSKPLSPLPYDLVFDLDGQRLLRVQCKWAIFAGQTVVIRCRRCRRGASGLIQRGYDQGEVDAFAAYSQALDRCFLVPVDDLGARTTLMLRVSPTRNNQLALVNWADDYSFAATLQKLAGP